MDCYGVLMCTPNPSDTLRLMKKRLAPGGTIRLMVYNKKARDWIFHIQKTFSLLDLDPYKPEDLRQAKKILKILQKASPPMSQKLGLMGPKTINLNPRLVDTFFHKREAQIDIEQWHAMFKDAGLNVYALFDRYGELDDLKNPLLFPPTVQSLVERAQDGRYENNLEVFLSHSHENQSKNQIAPKSKPSLGHHLLRRYMIPPPTHWSKHRETKSLTVLQKQTLWIKHLNFINGRQNIYCDDIINQVSPSTAKRLSRLGAIHPSQFNNRELRNLICEPIAESMPARQWHPPIRIEKSLELKIALEAILTQKKRMTQKIYKQVIRRLHMAQL